MDKIDKYILSRVDYIDKNFVKLFYIEEEYYDVVKTSQFLDRIELGDTVYYDFDANQNKVYRLYKKSEKKQFNLDQLYIISNIDDSYYYIIQNGSSKNVKVGRHQSGFSIYDLVNLEENENGIFLVNAQKLLPLKKAIEEFGDIKVKDFSVTRVFANEFYKKGVCISPVDNLEKLEYLPITKFEKNINYGDIYFDLRIGKSQKYVLDEFATEDVGSHYSAISLDKFPKVTKNSTTEEVTARTKDILKNFYEQRSELEKVGKKVAEEKPDYDESEILGEFYLDELEEDNIGKFYRAVNYNEEALNDEIKVYLKDLPPILAREGDSIVMVKDEFGKIKYYFTTKHIENSLEEKIEAEERRLAYFNKGGIWK